MPVLKNIISQISRLCKMYNILAWACPPGSASAFCTGKGYTVRNALADFTVCDWRRYCTALYDVKFIPSMSILRMHANFWNLQTYGVWKGQNYVTWNNYYNILYTVCTLYSMLWLQETYYPMACVVFLPSWVLSWSPHTKVERVEKKKVEQHVPHQQASH